MKIAFLRTCSAFTLAEVLIGLVLFGLLAVVLIPALSSLSKLEQTGRANGRIAAVVPFQEQLIARGFNPATNGVTAGPALTAVRAGAPSIKRTAWLDRPGRVSVWQIQSEADTSGKMLAFGFQLGGGTNLDDRKPLVEPLAPKQVSAPNWSPAGPVLDVSAINLPPETPNAPWRVRITVNSVDSTSRVKLRFFGPSIVSAEGIGSGFIEVSAVDLSSGAALEAWSEFAGTVADYSEALADGRTRWWASTADGLQLWAPSDKISQVFKIDVGAPVLTIGGVDFTSGQTISVDWNLMVAAAATEARIHFPNEVIAKFGTAHFAPSYTVAFQGSPGPASGDVTGFFSGVSLALWTGTSTLSGELPASAPGLISSRATWSLAIAATILDAPQLSPSGYDPSYYDGGDFVLSVPLVNGVPVGRVSSDEYESTGPTLTRPSSPY